MTEHPVNGHRLSAEVVTDTAALTQLRDQWGALWARCGGAGLPQTFEYCSDAWELVEQPRGAALACLVGFRDGELIAVWPFVTHRNRLWTYARQLGASGVELHELLIDGTVDRAGWTRQAWQALTAHGVDVVELSFSEASDTAAALRALPVRAVQASSDVAVRVDLGQVDDWDAYYASLNKSQRKNSARTRRRLDELGAVEFTVVEAGDERMGTIVDWLLAQKRRWADRTGKKGEWLYSAAYREFLVRQLGDPDQSARNLLMTLTLDGELLAAQLGAVGKGRFEGVIAAFNTDFDKFSPGALLVGDIIRWAWEQGLDCDLGAGAEPYKKFWSRGQEVAIAHRRVAVSRWGVAALGLRRAAQRWHSRRTRVSPAPAGS